MKGYSIKIRNGPRDIQIIALLCFLFKNMDKRLIEKIYAEEGKNIINSFLAIIIALR
jgi:hypothetical protein